jgi:hypothetical protein
MRDLRTFETGPVFAALFSVLLSSSAAMAQAPTVTAMWDASPATDNITSYQVCVGTSPLSCNVALASVNVTQTSHTITPASGTLHYVAIRALNANGVSPYSSEVNFSIPGLAQPTNQSSPVGTAITPLDLTATDPDGGSLTFTHTGLPPGLTMNSATGRMTGTPSAAGSYNVTVFVADNLASVSRSFVWTVTSATSDTTAPTLAITSHSSGQTVTSTSVTISGTATDSGQGGNGISRVTVNGVAAANGTASGSNTATWSRAITLVSGANTITVEAVDGAGNLRMQQITLNVSLPVAPVNSATILANLISPQNTGTAVTFTAAGSGGVAPLQYKFLVAQGGNAAQTVQSWSTTSTFTWTPSTAASYTVSVWVRSAGVTTDAAQASAQMPYTINTPPPAPVTAATLSANVASPQNSGTAVTFMAAGSGGVAPLQYKFLVAQGGNAAQTVQSWSTTSTFTWTPSTAASYTVSVWVRSAGVTTDAAQASAQMPYTINTPPPAEVTSATLSANVASPQNTGTPVIFTAGAAGGLGPRQYKFLVQRGNGGVQVAQDWSTSATYPWAPTRVGNYIVSVWARSAGVTTDAAQAAAQVSYVVQNSSEPAPIPSSEAPTTHVVDVNGDGRADVLTQDLTNRFWLSLLTTSGYSTPVPVLQHGGQYNPEGAHVADVNGDRRSDILFQGFDNGFWLSLSTGTGFTSPTHVLQHGGPFNPKGAHLTDVNGDGQADMLMQGFDNVFWLSLSTGTGFTSPTRVLQYSSAIKAGSAHVVDVNGDGKADVLSQDRQNRFWLSLLTSSGYLTPVQVLKHGGEHNPEGTHVADVNGDGRSDILFQGFDNNFWLSLSTGTGFTSPTSVLKHGGPFNPKGAHLADVNGDGRADVLMQGFDNVFWLSLSTGTGFTSPTRVLQHGGSFNPDGAHVVDVNGDGMADVLMQSPDNSFWLSLSTGTGYTSPTRVL